MLVCNRMYVTKKFRRIVWLTDNINAYASIYIIRGLAMIHSIVAGTCTSTSPLTVNIVLHVLCYPCTLSP